MKGHYLLIIVGQGKGAFERVHFPLLGEDETAEEATTRWIESHPYMVNRVRNRDRKERELRASIESVRISRPTSWNREQAEAQGLPWPVPVGRRSSRRRAA